MEEVTQMEEKQEMDSEARHRIIRASIRMLCCRVWRVRMMSRFLCLVARLLCLRM